MTATGATYTAYLNDDVSITEDVVIAGGLGYIQPGSNGIQFTAKENTVILVGTDLNASFVSKYFELDADSYDVVAGTGAAASVTIGSINVVSGKKVEAGVQNVPVAVSYTNSEGEEIDEFIDIEVTGISYVSDISKLKLTYEDHDEVESKKIYLTESYQYGLFKLDETSVTQFGDDSNLKLVGYAQIKVGESALKDGKPIEGLSQGGAMQTNWTNTTYSIVVSYTNNLGNIAYTEYVFTPTEK